MATGGTNGTVRLWAFDNEEAKALTAFPGKSSVSAIAFRHDSEFLVAGGAGGDIRLWKLGSTPRLASLPQAGGPICSVAFVGDDNRLVIGIGSEDRQPGQVWYWKIEDREGALNLHPIGTVNLDGSSAVSLMVFSSDGSTVVACDSENRLAAWRVGSELEDDRSEAKFVGEFRGNASEITKLAVSADGTRAASVSDDGQMYVWSIPDFLPIGKVSEILGVTIDQSEDCVTSNRTAEIQVRSLP